MWAAVGGPAPLPRKQNSQEAPETRAPAETSLFPVPGWGGVGLLKLIIPEPGRGNSPRALQQRPAGVRPPGLCGQNPKGWLFPLHPTSCWREGLPPASGSGPSSCSSLSNTEEGANTPQPCCPQHVAQQEKTRGADGDHQGPLTDPTTSVGVTPSICIKT